MPAPADIISMPTIKLKKLNGEWDQPWAPFTVDGPLTTGPLENYGILHVHHYRIPWSAQDLPILINGEYAAWQGDWVLKVSVGDGPGNCIEYTPELNMGTFELVIPAIGHDSGAWVWYSAYSHVQMPPDGIKVHNCIRISTLNP